MDIKTGIIYSEDREGLDICLSEAVALTDETGKASGWYKQIVSKVDAINGNVRLYPKAVYGIALDELKTEGFPNAGEHPHPPSYKGTDGKIHYKSSIPNSAVKFRNAYIDELGNVWAEYKTLLTDMGKQVQEFINNGLPIGFSNRMTGEMVERMIHDNVVNVAKRLKLYTWDVVLSPAENESFCTPIPLSDDINNILNEGDKNSMDFFNMTLEQLNEWKEQNSTSSDAVLCDQVIAVKETAKKAEDTAKALTDELKKQKQKEENELKKREVQKVLNDEVDKLFYDEKTKKAIIAGGKDIQDLSEIKPFLELQKEIVDSVTVAGKLTGLGIPIDVSKGIVYIGVAGGSGGKGSSPAKYASAHEFGSAKKNIPPRPYLRPSIFENKEQIEEDIKKAIADAMTGVSRR